MVIMTLTVQVPGGILQKARKSTEQTCVEPLAGERQRRCLAEGGYQDQAGSHEDAQHDACRRCPGPTSSSSIICPSVHLSICPLSSYVPPTTTPVLTHLGFLLKVRLCPVNDFMPMSSHNTWSTVRNVQHTRALKSCHTWNRSHQRQKTRLDLRLPGELTASIC